MYLRKYKIILLPVAFNTHVLCIHTNDDYYYYGSMELNMKVMVMMIMLMITDPYTPLPPIPTPIPLLLLTNTNLSIKYKNNPSFINITRLYLKNIQRYNKIEFMFKETH